MGIGRIERDDPSCDPAPVEIDPHEVADGDVSGELVWDCVVEALVDPEDVRNDTGYQHGNESRDSGCRSVSAPLRRRCMEGV